jgi:acetyltransferase-like isoleucine patch superfamily enzyme
MEVGKYTYGHKHITIAHPGSYKVKVGKFCSIADRCEIILCGNHRVDWISTYPFGHVERKAFPAFNGKGCPTGKGDVTIGNDVWIASHVTIMSGITIGDGAVIATNSHVVKDVPPYSIVGGNPAKVLKYRFSPEHIQKLQEIQWWDWPEAKINEFSPLLCSDNLDAFFSKVEENNSE